MRAIFAVGDGSTAAKLLGGHWALVSFAYVGSWVSNKALSSIRSACSGLVYDSGAFTEWQRAMGGKKAKGITLQSYGSWLLNPSTPSWDWALTFDVIGDAEASLRNFIELREWMKRNVPPDLPAPSDHESRMVPVWHEGDPVEHLYAYHEITCGGLIGLGRTDGRKHEKKTRIFYDEAFNCFPDGRFHALGNSNPSTVEPYPFESFDSTAWQRDSTYSESHAWPWNRVSKETRMKAYIEATASMRHCPSAKMKQMDLSFDDM